MHPCERAIFCPVPTQDATELVKCHRLREHEFIWLFYFATYTKLLRCRWQMLPTLCSNLRFLPFRTERFSFKGIWVQKVHFLTYLWPISSFRIVYRRLHQQVIKSSLKKCTFELQIGIFCFNLDSSKYFKSEILCIY